MGQMYLAFNKLAHAPADPGARAQIMADLQAATGDIMTQKSTLPGPIDQMAAAVADSGLAVAAGGARAYMDKIWHGGEGPLAACTALVTKHFPFDSTSEDDAPADDFAKIFAPGGTLDQFFNTHLKPYVDNSDHPWRWQSADGIQIHLPDDVLHEFERAAALRETLFQPDGKMPLARFDIQPVKVDERINTVTLDIDGQQLQYRHGPIRKTGMQWPGKEPTGARISFSPDRDEPATAISREGAWDFLRLLEAANLSQDGSADQYRLRFLIGDREAVFKVHAASVHNLFGSLQDFANFRCPNW
jgi:type VI secretion system protein ImpL